MGVVILCSQALGKELDNIEFIVGGKLYELLFEFWDSHDEVSVEDKFILLSASGVNLVELVFYLAADNTPYQFRQVENTRTYALTETTIGLQN